MPHHTDILRLRLRHQLLDPPASGGSREPDAVVEHMFALQAQDYPGSLWSVGVRCGAGVSPADVELAIAERRIVRTWPMRGTLHLLAPADVRWVLAFLAPRVVDRVAKRHETLGLTDEVFARARAQFTEELSGGRELSRPDAMAMLEADGIDASDQRGYHILLRLSQEALLCCGPMRDKQQTFVLLDDWIAAGTAQQDSPSSEQALARLAERYITARGPATIADFAWWAGISKGDARDGFDAIAHHLEQITIHGVEYWVLPAEGDEDESDSPSVHLLPGFDEYMLGYTDRSAQLGSHRRAYGSTVSSNGMFSATLVIDGRVAGTWRRTVKNDHVEIAVKPFGKLSAAEKDALDVAAARYGEFKGLTPVVQL